MLYAERKNPTEGNANNNQIESRQTNRTIKKKYFSIHRSSVLKSLETKQFRFATSNHTLKYVNKA